MSYNVDKLREEEYPWAVNGEMVHLNSASTGAMPRRSIDAAVAMSRRRATPGNIPDSEIFATLARSRTLLAQLVNCSADEIALAPNTSFGVNIAANCLPLTRGDVVLTFEREFPANVFPWTALHPRGVEVKFIACRDGLPDEQLLMESLDDSRVKTVAVSWVAFASGYRVDLRTLGRECRRRGIWFVVDGIQGLGPAALNLAELEVDIFASGCQKWLVSPWGTGFVYVRRELIPRLTPVNVGWLAYAGSENFATLTRYDLEFRKDARKFEVGTLGLQDFAAMNSSVELLMSLGVGAVEAHVASLVQMLSDWATAFPHAQLLSPALPAQRAGIVSIRFSDPEKVAAALRAAGIAISVREGAIRLAPHFFNTAHEMERTIGVMENAAAPGR